MARGQQRRGANIHIEWDVLERRYNAQHESSTRLKTFHNNLEENHRSFKRDNYLLTMRFISRATIDLEPKIRTVEENLILLLKKKTIVSIWTTKVRSYVCLFISRTICFSNVLFSLLGIVTKIVFSLAYLLNHLNAKPSLRNQLS